MTFFTPTTDARTFSNIHDRIAAMQSELRRRIAARDDSLEDMTDVDDRSEAIADIDRMTKALDFLDMAERDPAAHGLSPY